MSLNDVGCAREMTLDEWVDTLPPTHSARTELEERDAAYVAKIGRIADLEAEIKDLKLQIREWEAGDPYNGMRDE